MKILVIVSRQNRRRRRFLACFAGSKLALLFLSRNRRPRLLRERIEAFEHA